LRPISSFIHYSIHLACVLNSLSIFAANAAWYRISLLTYNVLSAMKSLVLPAELSAAPTDDDVPGHASDQGGQRCP